MRDKRITRLVKLLQILQGGRGQNWDGLAKECSVGRRTIYRDLETLRLAGVPLAFDAQAKRYSIPSGAFGPPSDLTAAEALSIWVMANSLGSHPQVPFYEPARTSIAKLERQLPKDTRQKFRKLAKSISFLPVKLSGLAPQTHFHQLVVEAIEKRRKLELVYSSLTEWERITTKIRPYQLLLSEHSWYIIGHSSMHREVRTFNLARIEALKLLSERFSIPKDFSVEKHFGNAWTMIPEAGRDSRVIVKFGSLVAKNVAQVNWHKTQKTTFKPDGSLIFEATVSGLKEISWWILRYGDQAEALHPLKLRRMIAQRVRKMAKTYRDTIIKLELVG